MPQALHNCFPSYSIQDLTTIIDICNGDFYKAKELLENCTLDNVLSILKEKFLTVITEESPRIQISPDMSSDDSLRCLLSFYKGSRYSQNAHVQVVVTTGYVLDNGGVRRQLYCSAFDGLACGQMRVFEGPQDCLQPIVRPSNIVSGQLKYIGLAIAHSLIMDNAGFPHLSLPIYYYLAAQENIAVTYLTMSDVCGKSQYVLSKVSD